MPWVWRCYIKKCGNVLPEERNRTMWRPLTNRKVRSDSIIFNITLLYRLLESQTHIYKIIILLSCTTAASPPLSLSFSFSLYPFLSLSFRKLLLFAIVSFDISLLSYFHRIIYQQCFVVSRLSMIIFLTDKS